MKKYIKQLYFLLFFIVFICRIFVLTNVFRGDQVIFVAAKPDSGFLYGYYYYVPQSVKNGQTAYLLVEPNNTGFPSDNKGFLKIMLKPF